MAIFKNENDGVLTFKDLDPQLERLTPKEYEDLDVPESDAVTGYDFLIPAIGEKEWDGHIYISGATGAGKSYMINKLVMNDRKKRMFFLFTNLEDPDTTLAQAYKTRRLKRYRDKSRKAIDVDLKFLKEHKKGSVMIFDDCDSDNREFSAFRDRVLEKGRHDDIMVICVNHKLRDHEASKKALNESRYVIAFPSSNRGAVNGFMKDRMEMGTKQRKAILKRSIRDGRHIVFHMFHPNMIATAKSIIKI